MSDDETGWVKDNGSYYYYYSNGEMAKGWHKIDGYWYYFYDDGSMAWGRTIDGYYVNNDGKWVTSEGWQEGKDNNDNITWYYVNSDGKAATGRENINNKWYYFDDDGKMGTGWQNIDGFWYYFYSSGEMATGWTETDNGWYYLYSDGSMTYDNTVGGYHLNSSGKMVTGTGWQYVDGSWYYLKDGGKVATDWLYNQGNWYYLYPQGSMAHATTVEGYYLDKTGKWTTDEDYIGDNLSNQVTDGAAVTYNYSDGSESAGLQGDNPNGGPTLEEAAEIAANVYSAKAGDGPILGDWQIVGDPIIDGSLQMAIYGRGGADGNMEYVVANAGTDPTSFK